MARKQSINILTHLAPYSCTCANTRLSKLSGSQGYSAQDLLTKEGVGIIWRQAQSIHYDAFLIFLNKNSKDNRQESQAQRLFTNVSLPLPQTSWQVLFFQSPAKVLAGGFRRHWPEDTCKSRCACAGRGSL